jgi:hypothetical protein
MFWSFSCAIQIYTSNSSLNRPFSNKPARVEIYFQSFSGNLAEFLEELEGKGSLLRGGYV